MKIAVFGAGTMGIGIAQVFAQKDDYQVVLCSSSLASAQRGVSRLESQFDSRIEKGKTSVEEKNRVLAKISTGTLDSCETCDLVIEAIPERLEDKRELFKELDTICKSSAVFASNTSSLSLSKIGEGLRHPVIGMHFFNPAPIMKLVEVVVTPSVSDEIIKIVTEVLVDIDKTPVVVKDSPGFVVNRVLIPMINEAIGLYAEGISSAEDIDTAMKLGANHPMGPLALGDLIGLDVCLAIMDTLEKETGDSKYRPHPLLREMVQNGIVGRKKGRGFYSYEKG